MSEARAAMDHFQRLPDTPDEFIREKVAVDRMLSCERSLLYVGGAGSCAGCGEASALRMLMAQLGWTVGRENIGLVAATGCNTVYSSTYPYNPFMVPWTNSLFENATAMAMGVRKRWDQRGWQDKALWVIGGDGALFDIGFGSLSRMLASGLNIKVLVLDTQVYSNTGGQASTASYTGQAAKMSPHGKVQKGKLEARKEIATIAMMHPDTYVAQTTAAHTNHFYRVISEAQSFDGPALVVTYTTCQPEHGEGQPLREGRLALRQGGQPGRLPDLRPLGGTLRQAFRSGRNADRGDPRRPRAQPRHLEDPAGAGGSVAGRRLSLLQAAPDGDTERACYQE